MSAATLLRYAYLAYFAKPQADRQVYRLIRQRKVNSIVELGIGDASRTQRMIDLASRYTEQKLRYTGVDLFESRQDDAPRLAYKHAHQLLKRTAANVRLVPGDPLTGLSRTANELTDTDLIVISADQSELSLQQAWFYIPRMIGQSGVVCWERQAGEGTTKFEILSPLQVGQLAGSASRQFAAAAA